MKFIHIADLHLGASLKLASFDSQIGKIRRKEFWDSFDMIINKCNEEMADILLIAGDLFEEKQITFSEVKRIADSFTKLIKTKVFIVSGNHDYMAEESYYNLIDFPDNVKIFRPDKLGMVDIEELNTRIYGFSWSKRTYDENILNIPDLDKDKYNILLIHCDVLSKSKYMPVDKDFLLDKGFDYIALGHIHKPMQVGKNMFYSGSLEPLDFSETGTHGYILGEISNTKRRFELTQTSLRKFIRVDIDVSGKDSVYDVEEDIIKNCDNFEKNLFRICFIGQKSEFINLDEIYSLISPKFFYVEFVDKTTPVYDVNRLYEENKDNIMGLFIKHMREEMNENKSYEKAMIMGIDALLTGEEK